MYRLDAPLHGSHYLSKLLGALKNLIVVGNQRQVIVRNLLFRASPLSSHIAILGQRGPK